jgi:hypothetical protein
MAVIALKEGVGENCLFCFARAVGWQKRPKNQHYHGGFSWQQDQVCTRLRRFQPQAIINGRADMPEGFHSREGDAALGDFDDQHQWEHCTTFAGTWGFHPNKSPKSPENGLILQKPRRLFCSILFAEENHKTMGKT